MVARRVNASRQAHRFKQARMQSARASILSFLLPQRGCIPGRNWLALDRWSFKMEKLGTQHFALRAGAPKFRARLPRRSMRTVHKGTLYLVCHADHHQFSHHPAPFGCASDRSDQWDSSWLERWCPASDPSSTTQVYRVANRSPVPHRG